MHNLTVRAKLTWAFGGLTILVLLIAGLAIKTLGDANDRFDGYVNSINARSTTAHLVREAIDARAIAARNLVLVFKPEDVAVEKDVVTKAHAQVGINLTKLKKLAEDSDTPEEARRMISEIDTIEQSYAQVALSIVNMALKGNREDAIAKLTTECRPLLAKLVKVSEEYSTYTTERSKKMVEAAAADYATQRNKLILVSCLAMVCAIVAGVLITRSLTRALGAEPANLCGLVGKVADGNLTSPLQVRDGDTVSVMAAVARMQTSLIQVVSTVRQGAEGVSTSSAEIASANHDLSARTEQQASALEETAASMEELGSTIKQNADNAQQANQLAVEASTVAVKGGEVVGQIVETMKEINDSSQKISDIISVIDNIAFQTNILALNAAVEAARAGEQGRGFAVVASEVRSLAGHVSDAAKEIKSLINISVKRVEQGATLVDLAGVTMVEVVSSIRRVTDIMGEISTASSEQAAGVAQVGEAVTQLDQATQQNAALVEEMAAAASSLKSQAQDLVQSVSVFLLSAQEGIHFPHNAQASVNTGKSASIFQSMNLHKVQRPLKVLPKVTPEAKNQTLLAVDISARAQKLAANGGAQAGWSRF